MASIIQPWVEGIGLRHQGVLVSAMRGCDIAPRYDPSKLVQRLLRGAVLEPHCGRTGKPMTYIMIEPDHAKWWEIALPFLRSWDHYPNHYVMHFIHATEIIGYLGPNEAPVFSDRWSDFYLRACHALHLNPESRAQLNERLDREEAAFYAAQENRS
jgi:hypothetical protein